MKTAAIFLMLSLITLVVFIVLSVSIRRRKAFFGLTWLTVMLAGTFLASMFLFAPVFIEEYKNTSFAFMKQIILSAYHSLALFFVASPFSTVKDTLIEQSPCIQTCYTLLAGIIYIVAPLLTIIFVLQEFSDFIEHIRYLRYFRREVFIFTELNEKAVALANNLKDDGAIVFAAGSTKKDENYAELIEEAREMNAIIFEKGIQQIDLGNHYHKSKLTFFAINLDEADSIRDALWIIRKYRDEKADIEGNSGCLKRIKEWISRIVYGKCTRDAEVFLFSDKPEAEMVLNRIDRGCLKVRRINEAQAFIYRTLYENSIFSLPYRNDADTEIKRICVVIVGIGRYGAEMLKAVSWCGQMDGFELEVHAFEQDACVVSRLKASCPELLDDQHNGKDIEGGDAKYSILLHSGIAAGTEEFMSRISEIPHATLIFLSLGTDSANIETALALKAAYERMGKKPEIMAVVYNSVKAEELKNASNFKKQPYGIKFVGDLNSLYSNKVVFGFDLEKEAFALHKCWSGNTDGFFEYEYNYRSSMASAIHAKYRKEFFTDRRGEVPTESEEDSILKQSILEHKRWNAYMRSEGYVFSGSLDKESRNDLGKVHHNLVPYGKLKEEDKIRLLEKVSKQRDILFKL